MCIRDRGGEDAEAEGVGDEGARLRRVRARSAPTEARTQQAGGGSWMARACGSHHYRMLPRAAAYLFGMCELGGVALVLDHLLLHLQLRSYRLLHVLRHRMAAAHRGVMTKQ